MSPRAFLTVRTHPHTNQITVVNVKHLLSENDVTTRLIVTCKQLGMSHMKTIITSARLAVISRLWGQKIAKYL